MRSSIMMDAFGISMESLDHFEHESVETPPEMEFTTVEVDEVVEAAETAAEAVVEHDEAVEDLSETAESLESLLVSLESAIENGGLDPQAADMHARAMHIATRRLPLDAGDYLVSTESFGGTTDKTTASMEALGKAKELIVKVWNAIKSAVKAAWQAAVNWVSTLGKGAGALDRAGKILVKAADDLKGKTPSKEKIDCLHLARYIHSDGSMPVKVTPVLSKILANATKVNAGAKKTVEYVKATIDKSVADGTDAEKTFEAMGDEYTKSIKQVMPAGIMPGGREIDYSGDVPKLSVSKELSVKEMTTAVPSIAEIRSLGVFIQQLARSVAEFSNKHYKGLQKDIESHIKKMDAEIQKMDMEKADGKAARARLKAFKKFANQARAVGPDYMHYLAVTAKASYSFGKRAAAAYQAPKAEPKAAE